MLKAIIVALGATVLACPGCEVKYGYDPVKLQSEASVIETHAVEDPAAAIAVIRKKCQSINYGMATAQIDLRDPLVYRVHLPRAIDEEIGVIAVVPGKTTDGKPAIVIRGKTQGASFYLWDTVKGTAHGIWLQSELGD